MDDGGFTVLARYAMETYGEHGFLTMEKDERDLMVSLYSYNGSL